VSEMEKEKLEEYTQQVTSILDGTLSSLAKLPVEKPKQPESTDKTKSKQEEPITGKVPNNSVLLNYGDKIAQNALLNSVIQGIHTTDIEYRMCGLLQVLHPPTIVKSDIPMVTSMEELGARLTELYHFLCKDRETDPPTILLTQEEMEKELILFRMEEAFQKHGGKDSFGDRIYREDFTAETLMQVLSNVSMFSKYNLINEYYDMEDAALCIYYKHIPNNRYITEDRAHTFAVPTYFGESMFDIQRKFETDAEEEHDKKYDNTHIQVAKLIKQKKEREALNEKMRQLKQKQKEEKASGKKSKPGSPKVGSRPPSKPPSRAPSRPPSSRASRPPSQASRPPSQASRPPSEAKNIEVEERKQTQKALLEAIRKGAKLKKVARPLERNAFVKNKV
jgi:hypothetical protein